MFRTHSRKSCHTQVSAIHCTCQMLSKKIPAFTRRFLRGDQSHGDDFVGPAWRVCDAYQQLRLQVGRGDDRASPCSLSSATEFADWAARAVSCLDKLSTNSNSPWLPLCLSKLDFVQFFLWSMSAWGSPPSKSASEEPWEASGKRKRLNEQPFSTSPAPAWCWKSRRLKNHPVFRIIRRWLEKPADMFTVESWPQ